MRFGFVHLVMLPSQALRALLELEPVHILKLCSTYLCNTQSSPFLLPKQFQSPLGAVKVVCGDFFEHILWELHMAIFEFVIVVSIWSQWRVYRNGMGSSPCRVVNRVHKFIQLLALRLQEETGLLVAPSWVDVHWDSGLRRPLSYTNCQYQSPPCVQVTRPNR